MSLKNSVRSRKGIMTSSTISSHKQKYRHVISTITTDIYLQCRAMNNIHAMKDNMFTDNYFQFVTFMRYLSQLALHNPWSQSCVSHFFFHQDSLILTHTPGRFEAKYLCFLLSGDHPSDPINVVVARPPSDRYRHNFHNQ